MMKIVHAKLVVIGPHAVGKTSLITRHETNTFSKGTTCTVGASFSTFERVHGDIKIKIQVWDTAGQERFRSMAPLFYRGTNAALLVFDLTNLDSLESLDEWATEIVKQTTVDKMVLAVAGNKSDLQAERQVNFKQGKEFASKWKARYFETSALDSSGVNDLFEYFSSETAKKILENVGYSIQEEKQEKNVDLLSDDLNLGPKTSNNCCKK